MSDSGDTPRPIPKLLGLLKHHRDLIEALYYDRDAYFPPHEEGDVKRLKTLQRERVVQIFTDNQGGCRARLRTEMRRLLDTTLERERLQGIGIDIDNELHVLQHLVDSWRASDDPDHRERQEESMHDLIEGIDQQYSEQLEDLRDRIASRYGFDGEREQRSRDFDFYHARLDKMYAAGKELLKQLGSEAYMDVTPVLELHRRMIERFRVHGNEIRDRQNELKRHINRVRLRREHTRRWIRRIAVLRENGGEIRWNKARAAATDRVFLRRPAGIPLSGHPDWEREEVVDQVRKITVERERHRKKRMERSPERPPSGKLRDPHRDRGEAVDDRTAVQASGGWDPIPWVNDFLREVVRAHRTRQSGEAVSALAFLCDRQQNGDGEGAQELPTPRAWLHQVIHLNIADEAVGDARFSERFVMTFDEHRSGAAQRIIRDVQVAVRT